MMAQTTVPQACCAGASIPPEQGGWTREETVAAVEIRSVRKSFGRVDVIHGIDLTVKDGEFVVLVGPSGCGKSTLLRMIAGLEGVSDGEIRIGDKVVNDLPPREPRHRDGVPGLRALSAQDGGREHRLRPAHARHAEARDGEAGPRGGARSCRSAI